MKRVAVVALVVLSATSGFGQWPQIQKHGMKGPVKQVTQVQSPVRNSQTDLLDGYSGENYTEEYNRQGLLTKRISRDDFNQPHHVSYFEYNRQGELTKRRQEPLSPHALIRTSGSIYYRFEPKENTWIVEDRQIYGAKPVNTRTMIRVDSVRRMAHVRSYAQDTLLVSESYRFWDAQKNDIRMVSRHNIQDPGLPGASKLSRSEFEDLFKKMFGSSPNEQEMKALDSLFNSRDSLTRVRKSMGPGWRADTTDYKNVYDEKQRLISQETWRQGRLLNRKRIQYTDSSDIVTSQNFDQQGQLTYEGVEEVHPIRKNTLRSRTRMKLDKDWQEHESDYTTFSVPNFQYTYDRFGNWIERKQVNKNGAQVGPKLVRTIAYY